LLFQWRRRTLNKDKKLDEERTVIVAFGTICCGATYGWGISIETHHVTHIYGSNKSNELLGISDRVLTE